MPSDLGPCDQTLTGEVCGAPGWKSLGIHTYCTTHFSQWLLSCPPSGVGIGVGLQDGPLAPEYGPGWAELRCWVCGAGWVGVIGDECYWCVRSMQNMLDWQAELTLRPPDLELSDIRRPKALEAWKERLKVARDAGIITREEAKSALGRELKRTN